MSDLPGDEAELAAIHAEFAEPVRYTGAGLTDESVGAVRLDLDLPDSNSRMVRFELPQSAFSGPPPGRGDTIVDSDGSGTAWRAIEAERRDDVSAWWVTVERA